MSFYLGLTLKLVMKWFSSFSCVRGKTQHGQIELNDVFGLQELIICTAPKAAEAVCGIFADS